MSASWFAEAYRDALQAYLSARDEPARAQAYELGRTALKEGLGLYEVNDAHHQAVAALVREGSLSDEALLAAATFLRELLSPFEMSFRGYRQANEQLQQLNGELTHQKEALQDINQELEAFSYSVSHDLRAPVRAIDGFSRILLEEMEGKLEDRQQTHLRRVLEGAQQMREIIDALLSLSRISRGTMERTSVDLSAMARATFDRLAERDPARKVERAVAEGLTCQGDPRLLAVVFENLLGNAWKFTSKQEVAHIAFGRSAEGAFFVRDDGAGFDMQYASKLFRAFQRLHAQRDFDGTGIGLATVQRVVRRHGGRIWAQAQPGAGATFYFTIGDAEASP